MAEPAIPSNDSSRLGNSQSTNRVIEDVLARIQRLSTSDSSTDLQLARDSEPPPPTGSPLSTRPPKSKDWYQETGDKNEPFLPLEPVSLSAAGLSDTLIEEIVVRYLFSKSEAAGKQIADQIKLPFRLIEPVLLRLKAQQLTGYVGSTATHDYIHVLSDAGRDRARRYLQKTTYFGAAPVQLDDYIESVKAQSVERQNPNREQLRKAFSDLLIPPQLLARLGPAINSGRGMFLFGFPGNGKTSIAERVTKAFGEHIWIPPRSLC